MRLLKALALLAVFGVLIVGCSEDKKEQAAQLEEEMAGQEEGLDTTADTMAVTEPTTDTAGVSDIGAIPAEGEEAEPERSFPGAPAGGGFTVQVASCEDPEYAEYLVDLYRQRGYEPFVTEATIDGQPYHRVRVGNFDTYEGAEALQQDLLNKYSVDGWIAEIGGY